MSWFRFLASSPAPEAPIVASGSTPHPHYQAQPLPERVDELAACLCDDPTVPMVAGRVAAGEDLMTVCRHVYGGITPQEDQ